MRNFFKAISIGAFLLFTAITNYLNAQIARQQPELVNGIDKFHNDFNRVEKISFGDSVSFDLDDHAHWTLVNLGSDEILIEGEGPIEQMAFTMPGKFIIDVPAHNSSIGGECQHSFNPEKILIDVSPFKLTYDFGSINFSREITGNTSVDNVTVIIDAEFESYYGETKDFQGSITSSGVGSEISGYLSGGPIELKEGLNHLEFALTGQAKSGTYIMLDFFDVNGLIQCYYFTSPLK